MQRPDFETITDYDQFCKYYWYRNELVKICKTRGLKSDGTKLELNAIIKAFFSGEKILPQKKPLRKKNTVKNLTLDTGLIECDFTFGQRFRDYFAEVTGKPNFKFNVDMVATVKEVKNNNDESFTLGNLLDIYNGRQTYAKYDKSALQWNNFVKDFCADDATQIFPKRLKTAAKLWKIVRESDLPKVYSHELLRLIEK